MSSIGFRFDTLELAGSYEEASARLARTGRPLLAALDLHAGDQVLDVGCGTGLLAEHAANLVGPSGAVVGIDPLPHRIEIARRRARPNLRFRVASVFDLSEWAAQTFDAAYMHAVFHWFAETREPLRKVQRILKPGARLGLTTVAREQDNTFESAWLRVLRRPPYDAYPEAQHARPSRISAAELEAVFAATGFIPRRIDLQPSIACWSGADAAEQAIVFFDTISFGNLFGHLPAELRDGARAALVTELNSLRKPFGLCLEGARLTAVAVRA
jgi:SAM-dependent methyltransferase